MEKIFDLFPPSGLTPCTVYTFTLHQSSSNIELWRLQARTLVSLDIQLHMGLYTATMSSVYR